MHVKRVSNVTIYLCNFFISPTFFLSNVMKISVKINTMQNIDTFLSVRSLSLTNWRNA